MKINRLSIANFRNHRKTEIILDRVNFFAGHNNAGKTSILAAIEWAITGRCMWTDKAGRGAAELICQGEKQAAVALDVVGLGAVIRSLPPHSLQVGRVFGINEGQVAIHNYLGVDEDRLRLALNAGAFLSMTLAEQRSFLFSAYGLSWAADQVAAELARWLIEKGYKEEETGRLAKKAKGYYPAGITGGPEIFEAMEKRAKEERKEVKRDKQRAEATLAEMEDNSPAPVTSPGQADQIKIRLNELKKKHSELMQSCGASKEARARRESLLLKIHTVEEKISAAQETASILAAELEQLGEPVDSPGETEQELLAKVDAITKDEASARSKLEAIDKAGQALSSKEMKCPLAPDHLQCCLTKEQIDTVLITLRKEHKLTSQQLKNYGIALAQVRAELAEFRREQNESRGKASQVLVLKGKLNTQHVLVDSLLLDKEALEKEWEGLPEADADAIIEEDIRRFTGLIAEGEKALKQQDEAAVIAEKKAALARDIGVLTTEVADLEVLVKALGPDGLRKDLLSGILAGFIGRVNDRLGRLTEGAYQVALDGDMTLLCRANGGPLLPLKILSKSEQLRVGIAVSEALSAAAGLRFLAIDEADMLDQENRNLLAGMVLDTADEFDQVLVCTTVGDVQPANPGLPGVQVFWVEEGVIKEI